MRSKVINLFKKLTSPDSTFIDTESIKDIKSKKKDLEVTIQIAEKEKRMKRLSIAIIGEETASVANKFLSYKEKQNSNSSIDDDIREHKNTRRTSLNPLLSSFSPAGASNGTFFLSLS